MGVLSMPEIIADQLLVLGETVRVLIENSEYVSLTHMEHGIVVSYPDLLLLEKLPGFEFAISLTLIDHIYDDVDG